METAWQKGLERKLKQLYKEKESITRKPDPCLSESYLEDYSLEEALSDVACAARLSLEKPLLLYLYQKQSQLHLRLFQLQQPMPLSDILPLLENFGLRTERDNHYKIGLDAAHCVWISDFLLHYSHNHYNLAEVKDLFQEAFHRVLEGDCENDGFNKLVIGASLSWSEAAVLRAYAKYLQQTGFRFSPVYLEKTLAKHPLITRELIKLFVCRFSPELKADRDLMQATLEQQIHTNLEDVASLDEDRIIRRYLALIKATLRTTYFTEAPCLAFKLNSAAIPELPLPIPLCEIFVYSPRLEGIHLRKEKIARGGIRWSERPEDFRTEILGLMKAQVVKNTVIVPSGAKGGFVLKALPAQSDREVLQHEVVACYQLFISALLALTDNIKQGNIIRPKSVVCYDDPDPYLVVAADKGTASFSDLANHLSEKHHFWLGDAFASGGSTGYDHKKMGITARGAWESIKRHFREMDRDVMKATITMVGIGDMSGDVFGNGALYTKGIKLLAAFDHRHIFIDPNPDPAVSYKERERLFRSPLSSWEDYSPALISKGGGVFRRSLKSIKITDPMKESLGITEEVLTPNELIAAVLKAPVDLLFNGGIGTYVKGSLESNAEVGDRTNDYCRVNGAELRCKVVGEGGNMGFTQRGRIEYAENGGLIFTDFIDNSAGVDCSDHEVNLKILLGNQIEKGHLTLPARNVLLTELTKDVADLVLEDNKTQALVLSFSAFSAKDNLGLQADYIKELESLGLLNRKVEFLPSPKDLADRKGAGLGLTRPELAVLLAYTKIYIKKEILNSALPEDPHIQSIIETAFPGKLGDKYRLAMCEHSLKRDIVATQLSNKVVNQMGITFVYKMQIETGATVEEIIRAFVIASESFNAPEFQRLVDSLDFKIPMHKQFEILHYLRRLVNLSTRWFLQTGHYRQDLKKTITHFGSQIRRIEHLVPELMSGMTKEYLRNLVKEFTLANIPKETAERIAAYRAIYTALNIVEVASVQDWDLEKTARVYFSGGERMNLVWFRDELANDASHDYWHSLTRLILRDELDTLQRALTVAIMKVDRKEENTALLIDKWVAQNPRLVQRWDKFLSMLHESTMVDYSMFFIAIRELSVLFDKGE